jgi:hypothetical protein
VVRHTKTLNFFLLFPAFTAQLFVELLKSAAGGGFLQISTGLSDNDTAVTKPA